MKALYELSGVKHRYNGRLVLDIPRLVIEEGDIVGLVGPNGSGKSTLLRILAFLEAPSEGTLCFDGVPVGSEGEPPRRDATLLLQDSFLLKRSVFDNVTYGLKVRREKSLRKKAFEALEMVGLPPEEFAHRPWYALSGGEAQRVALAARLVLRPKVLLLDEPTANVDEASAILIKEAVLRAVKEWKTTVVVATHDLLWLYEVAKSVLNLYQGRIAAQGTSNLISGPWRPLNDGLWERVFPDGQRILAVSPPSETATAILDPSDIVIATSPPAKVSAQNILSGRVTQMLLDNSGERVAVTISLGGASLRSTITPKAVEELSIQPGQRVWVLFKATTLRWL